MAMDVFSIQETAAMLKVSPMTIRRYIASGKLPAMAARRRRDNRLGRVEESRSELVLLDSPVLTPDAYRGVRL